MLLYYFQDYLMRTVFYFSVLNVLNAFTVEELKGINYEVDISVRPVKKEVSDFENFSIVLIGEDYSTFIISVKIPNITSEELYNLQCPFVLFMII